MIEPKLNRLHAQEPSPQVAESHDTRTANHLANERTHLAYLRTSLALMGAGIAVNRVSLYFKQHDARPSEQALLDGTASVGFWMVVYALVLLLLALHRYRSVDEAIERGAYHADRPIVELVTVSIVVGAAAGILWMFRA